jgi:hypothetical protein
LQRLVSSTHHDEKSTDNGYSLCLLIRDLLGIC